jgi:hypothetical protein
MAQLRMRPVAAGERALPSDATDALALALHHMLLMTKPNFARESLKPSSGKLAGNSRQPRKLKG